MINVPISRLIKFFPSYSTHLSSYISFTPSSPAMPELLDECKRLLGSKDVYKILGVQKSASQEQLKKGYYKVSLKVHPDKVKDDAKDKATEKFKLLSKLYRLMSDEKKRKIYDNTGEIDEDDGFGLSDNKDWQDYWRDLFPIITVDDINKFHSKYKGSDKELSALKEAYVMHKGDMQKIIDSVMCASMDDEERFKELLTPFIMSKELPTYKRFTDEPTTSKRKRHEKASKEAKEAEKAAKELKGGSLDGYNDLALALKRNREKRGGIISYLEEKYANADNEEDDLVIDSKPKKRGASGKNSAAKASGTSKPQSKRLKKK